VEVSIVMLVQNWLTQVPQVAIVGFVFLCLVNGFDVFWPENWSASSFLTAYVGIPIFLCIYFAHRIYAFRDPWAHNPEDVDLHTGLEEVVAQETPAKVYDKWWKKVQMIWE
jgi:yeast amino acid transporter